jgi:hypothetical protein
MPAVLRMELIAVWHISRSPDPRAWGRCDHVVANDDAVLAFKGIERFVLPVMHVESVPPIRQARRARFGQSVALTECSNYRPRHPRVRR